MRSFSRCIPWLNMIKLYRWWCLVPEWKSFKRNIMLSPLIVKMNTAGWPHIFLRAKLPQKTTQGAGIVFFWEPVHCNKTSHIILDEPISCHLSFTKDPGLMAAIIVTKPEDLISFSSEKNDDPMFGKHTDSDVWAPQTNKDDENTGPSWVGAKTPNGKCKASRWFFICKGGGWGKRAIQLSNCLVVC